MKQENSEIGKKVLTDGLDLGMIYAFLQKTNNNTNFPYHDSFNRSFTQDSPLFNY